jgi:hypothetical protein
MAGSSTEPPAEGVSKINITGGETQPPLGQVKQLQPSEPAQADHD